MDCKEVQDLLIEFIDEPLYINENSLIQEHLSVCKECRQYCSDIQASLKCMKEMGKLEPPLELAEKIMEKLKGEEKYINLRKIFHIMKMPMGIAAASLIILAFIYVYFYEKYFYEKAETDLRVKIENTPKVSVLEKKEALTDKRYKEKADQTRLEEPQLITNGRINAKEERKYLAQKKANESIPKKEEAFSEKKYKEEEAKAKLKGPQLITTERVILKEQGQSLAEEKAESISKFEGESLEKKETDKKITAAEENKIAKVEEPSIKPKPIVTEDYISKSEFNIVLYVSNIDFASKEIKNIIKETNSILIKEEILKDKKLISVLVDAKSFQSIIEKLKRVGEMKNLVLDFSKIKGILKLNIEIRVIH